MSITRFLGILLHIDHAIKVFVTQFNCSVMEIYSVSSDKRKDDKIFILMLNMLM